MIAWREQQIDYESCVAFYLGDLDPDRARAVESWLRMRPEIARRARRDAQAQTQIKRYFDIVIDEPVPTRLLATNRPAGLRWPMRLGMAASIVLAGVGGWWLGHDHSIGTQASPTFSQRVAEISQSQPQHVVLSNNSQRASIRHPDLSAQGYTMVASKILQEGDRPLIKFLYRSDTNEQIRIYAQPEQNRLTDMPRLSSENGVSLARWRDHGVDYALVGNVPSDSLETLAQTASGAAAAGNRNRSTMNPPPANQRGETAMPAAHDTVPVQEDAMQTNGQTPIVR